MKLADNGSILEYIADLKTQLDLKSPASHRHARVNGLKVVVSDTAPTDNDESVITLIVDTADVPSVGGLTFSETHAIESYMSYIIGFFYLEQTFYTFHAYLDGVEVPAEFQVENGSTILRAYSTTKTFRCALASFTVRVRYGDFDAVFSVSQPVDATAAALLPQGDSYFYHDGTKISSSDGISYEDATDDLQLIYKYDSSVSASDFTSIRIDKVTANDTSGTAVDLDDIIEACTTTPVGTFTLGSTEATFTFSDTFTDDDIGSIDYLVTATAANGKEYYWLPTLRIIDIAFANNIVDVYVSSFLNVKSTGNGRMVFITEVEDYPDKDYTVAAEDITQPCRSTSTGTHYGGDSESTNCNLWYSEPLQSGDHIIHVWLIDPDSGEVASNIYTLTVTFEEDS